MAKLDKQTRLVLSLSALGGGLEMYDFTLYLLFAHVLAQLFFPKENALAGLLGVFAIFAIGYLVRPIGGMILGHIGDVWGRKKTFIISALLMAISTVLIACLPTYERAGIVAPVLLVLLRILQGLSVGGEVPGALVFSCEHMTPNQRGFAGGFLFMGINFGITFGALVVLLCHHFYSHDQLIKGIWRIPFIIGGILGVVSFYLRKRVHETPVFSNYLKEETTYIKRQIPFLTLLKSHKRYTLKGFIITWMGANCTVSIFLYLPTYLGGVYSTLTIAWLNFISLILLSLLNMIGGIWSDRWGRSKTLLIVTIGLLAVIYPSFVIIHQGYIGALIAGMGLICLITGLIIGIYPTLLTELFPVNVRYTGVAISYNIGFALAGLGPLITTLLKQILPLAIASCLYILIATVLAIAMLVFFKPSSNY